MAITVTGKLNKGARTKPLESGDMLFIISIGKQEYNRQAQEKVWVNYSAALYAKQSQVQFYTKATAQGSIVTVSGSGILPRLWGDANDRIDLTIMDPTLEYAGTAGNVPQQQAQQPMQQPQAQPHYQQPQGQSNYQQPPAAGPDDFDGIPF